MSYSYLFKYIIIGDQSVGKSCILMQFIDKMFKNDSDPTIGVEFGSKTIKIKDKTIKLQIWDTAGQEAYKSITRSYYRSTIGAILVYDITSRRSFESLSKWVEQTHKYATNQNLVFILVGNKEDLSQQREVSMEEGLQFAQKNGLRFMECSAKTGNNVDAVFELISQTIMQNIEAGNIDPFVESGGIKIGESEAMNFKLEKRRCC